MLEHVILGFLYWGDKSGYDIKQHMSTSTAFFYDASYGSIYPILNKLARNEWAVVKEVVVNGKFKKVYAITPKGKEIFFAWLEELPQASESEMLGRMLFYPCLPRERVIPLIEHYIKINQQVKQSLNDIDASWESADRLERAALQYGRDFYGFHIQWFERLRDQLRKEGY